MNHFYDALETRSPAEREAAHMQALPRQVAHAQAQSPAMHELLAGIDARAVTGRAALARLPVIRKGELHERQKAGRTSGQDVFGGFAAVGFGAGMPRVFASPGPIYEPEGTGKDYWRMARAIYAAGFRSGELVHNCFSYHFVPAGSMMETGAHALGCTVFPGGTGQTEQQVQAMAELKPAGYIGTPSFLKIIVDKAQEMGIALPSLKKAMVGGEAFPPSLRDWFTERGIDVYQSFATADLGLIAYETSAREGLVLDEGVIVEIVRPGTGDPVPEGEVGELVVTTLNPDYPLIRFGTGDLSAVLPGACPTGRTNARIRGWMGRADQTVKIRGMFVHPGQVADIARRFPEVIKARLVVSGEMANDSMTFQVEAVTAGDTHAGLDQRISEAIRDVTKLRGTVELLSPGSLPNDGKVIEDVRSYK
ncbi:MAG: AMP-dependent synthetase [Polaromonas sp. 39-63-203]|jgi:phenylacetate-CoA ligase|uniref:phenylacetate--CoA ligase family protein n=1 Tax=Polaromonas sp. TaxID=1869339 RepID=UPI000BDB30E4|nr:AMP-binding protein [Polaromonas sp.]OYY49153.1 MAG: AMP-dependent synthetase [Polaromonas sp. 35-63-240]OYY96797.1 MAG: AMP-dependent synthetase [Polaromonas sp. 28-63-22]OYZ77091.1 MAG: AMP-dependent synthetase [Polaromonas sp. 24-62-144]OZA94693.1 MAG: AMP-dependent synthetase [Polaromonas sp. 39-63-203]HQS31982.1 AMP-binding protein [Polaromonas sp.]